MEKVRRLFHRPKAIIAVDPKVNNFKLYKEGVGYFWLLVRGFSHRLGILWF